MVNKLSALIVDDEENARKLLFNLLEDLQCFSDIRMADSAPSAHAGLALYDPDLIFVDIKMPGKDGFSFISDLPIKSKKPEIVFVTAYDQFALKAIKSQAFDYLLKPVDRKELRLCVEKFLEKRERKSQESSGKISRIRINTRTGTVFVNPDNILYCRADRNYTVICTGKKEHLCSMQISKVNELLRKETFLRVGRSYIINGEYVTLLDRKESVVVLARDGESVSVKIPRENLKDLDII
ncbi:MAG TPA: LytTR family DNA-binding domain-containing protein [Bacteroidales bacterium]|nr:LytTR family DNA-binding domain-containing protein [Bacteroidales bacterium]